MKIDTLDKICISIIILLISISIMLTININLNQNRTIEKFNNNEKIKCNIKGTYIIIDNSKFKYNQENKIYYSKDTIIDSFQCSLLEKALK